MTHGEKIKTRILDIGLKLWRCSPAHVTARRIAAEIGMSHSAVLYHFKHSAGLKEAIAQHAIERGDSRVIVHLIADQHPSMRSMSDADKLRHMAS